MKRSDVYVKQNNQYDPAVTENNLKSPNFPTQRNNGNVHVDQSSDIW